MRLAHAQHRGEARLDACLFKHLALNSFKQVLAWSWYVWVSAAANKCGKGCTCALLQLIVICLQTAPAASAAKCCGLKERLTLVHQARGHLPDALALQGAQRLLHNKHLVGLVQNKCADADLRAGRGGGEGEGISQLPGKEVSSQQQQSARTDDADLHDKGGGGSHTSQQPGASSSHASVPQAAACGAGAPPGCREAGQPCPRGRTWWLALGGSVLGTPSSAGSQRVIIT